MRRGSERDLINVPFVQSFVALDESQTRRH